MGKQDRFADEFKRDAVAEVVDRRYPVRTVAERLGVRWLTGECEAIAEKHHHTTSIDTWQQLFSRPMKAIQKVDAQADDIRRRAAGKDCIH